MLHVKGCDHKGCRFCAMSETGLRVNVYDAKAQGIDASTRLVVVCEHGSISETDRMRDALHLARHPHHWCEQCKWPKPTVPKPALDEIESWDAIVQATDGCQVEPDGACPHGHVSWLLYLGFI